MENPKFFHVLEKREPSAKATARPRYKFGPFELDTEEHTLTRQNVPVTLPPKCFDLLCILVRNSGSLLEKEYLMRELWPDTFVEEANLSNLVALLRKALGDSPARSQYIKTVPKFGYRFTTPPEIPFSLAHAAAAPAIVPRQPAIRIIVFPFRTEAGFQDADNLAYSLPDDISSTLAELNAFVVRSIQAAMGFDPVHWEPKLVAKEADVDYILTGRLGSGERHGIRATVKLIQAPSGALVWSRSWDIDASELQKLHHGVVQLVLSSLARGTADEGTASALTGTTIHAEAYNLYLMANQLSLKRDPKNMTLARDLYIACLEKDPTFAAAWARLGRSYRFVQKFGPDPNPDYEPAQEAVERAFALNPDLILAHNVYTPIQADMGHAERAMVRLLKTVASHPNAPGLFAALVQACRYCGQLDASLAAHRRALELDPNALTSVTHTYFLLGDYERSLFWYGTVAGYYLDALVLACMSREQEALNLLWTRQEKLPLMPAGMQSLLAYLEKDRDRGIAVLRASRSDRRPDPEMYFYLARQAAKFNEPELASQLLQQSVEAGFWSTSAFLRDPWLESIRSTSEFNRIFHFAKQREEESRTAFLAAGGERILFDRSEPLASPNISEEVGRRH